MDQRSVFRVFLDDLRPGSRAGREEREATRRADVDAEAARVLAAATDPALRAVLELHRPVIERVRLVAGVSGLRRVRR